MQPVGESHSVDSNGDGTSHIDAKYFACTFCGQQFLTRQNCHRHELSHSNHNPFSKHKPFSCKICGKQFLLKDNCKRHELVHSNEKPYSCKFCSKQFTDKSSCNRHQFLHSNEKSYYCKFCSKQFKDRSSCRRHEIIVCGKKTDATKLNHQETAEGANHQETVEGANSVMNIPTDAYKINSAVKVVNERLIHLRHCHTKPFACRFCFKRFSCNRNRKVHERIHTNHKPFSCKFCGKKFSDHSNHRRHEARLCTHSSQSDQRETFLYRQSETSRFACRFCFKQFSYDWNRKVHERIHTNNKPFSCKFCGKKFSDRSNHKRHEARLCTHSSQSDQRETFLYRQSETQCDNTSKCQEENKSSNFGDDSLDEQIGKNETNDSQHQDPNKCHDGSLNMNPKKVLITVILYLSNSWGAV